MPVLILILLTDCSPSSESINDFDEDPISDRRRAKSLLNPATLPISALTKPTKSDDDDDCASESPMKRQKPTEKWISSVSTTSNLEAAKKAVQPKVSPCKGISVDIHRQERAGERWSKPEAEWKGLTLGEKRRHSDIGKSIKLKDVGQPTLPCSHVAASRISKTPASSQTPSISRSEYDALKAENEEFKAKYDDMKAEHEEFKTKYDDLKADHKNIMHSHEGLLKLYEDALFRLDDVDIRELLLQDKVKALQEQIKQVFKHLGIEDGK